jgi:hypothetical protein
LPEELATPATAPAPETTTEQSAAAQQAPEAVAAPESVDLSALDRVDPQALRTHPRVAGILGDMLHREKSRWEQGQKAEAERIARERAEQELLDLARTDPYEFSQKYLQKTEAERLQAQIAQTRSQAQQALVADLGKALGTSVQLTPAEVERLSAALAGKGDHEVVPAFADAIADIKAERKLAERVQKELAKEREAWAQQEASKALARGQRPDLGKPAGAPARIDPIKLPDTEFNEWYERTYKVR